MKKSAERPWGPYANRQAYERNLAASRAAKAKRRGTCEECGAETRYGGHTTSPVSQFCHACAVRRVGASKRGKGRETQRVLNLLAENGPMHFAAIGRALGKDENWLSHYIYQMLLPYGLIERRGRGIYARVDK